MKTISLETAKELHEVAKEKGVELPESEYYWGQYEGHASPKLGGYKKRTMCFKKTRDWFGAETSAYDTNELLEILPSTVKQKYNLYMGKIDGIFICDYENPLDGGLQQFVEKEPQEALAKLLQYLIANNLYNETTN